MYERQTKELKMLRGYIIQSITMMWLTATSFILFVFMAYKFQFGEPLLFIIVLVVSGVLTFMSAYFIQRIEFLIKLVWERIRI